MVIQETKHRGNRITEIREYIFFYSEQDDRKFGPGFQVAKEMMNKVIEFEFTRVSSRLGKLGVKCK